MLILPIEKKWFDMILAGEKLEEYRETKPYWIKRVVSWLGFQPTEEDCALGILRSTETLTPMPVLFRNGYGAGSPCFVALCTVRIGAGRKEWGAEGGKLYFVFRVHRKTRVLPLTQAARLVRKLEAAIWKF